jgi:hypothetical protein
MIQTASAHKSEVFGNYKVEIGWEKEPPLVNVDNKITLKVTHAVSEEKITGLAPRIGLSVTISGEKTDLTVIEDKTIPGQYYAEFTPRHHGYPIVHVLGTVYEQKIDVDFHPERVEDGAIIQAVTQDGSTNVKILATAPQQNRWMLIMLEFTDRNENPIKNINYDIFATQNGKEILSRPYSHSADGSAKHSTVILDSAEPVQIQVKVLGVGPSDGQNWTGSEGKTVTVQVVPEFGPLHLAILAFVMGAIVLTEFKRHLLPQALIVRGRQA